MDFVTLVTALGGASIGALSSIATLWIQSHYQTSRELKKMAIEFAQEDYRSRLQDKSDVLPASVLIYYYVELIGLADKGQLNDDSIRHLLRRQARMTQSVLNEIDSWTSDAKRKDGSAR